MNCLCKPLIGCKNFILSCIFSNSDNTYPLYEEIVQHDKEIIEITDLKEYKIILMGETGSGKTSLINLIINVLENNTPNDKLKIFESVNQNDTIDTKYYLKTDEKFKEQGIAQTKTPVFYKIKYNENSRLILMDTPGMCMNLEGNPDQIAVDTYTKLLRKNIDVIIYVQKANDSLLDRSILATLNSLATKIKSSNIKIILFYTFYPGNIIFKEESFPFKVAKSFMLDNSFFYNIRKSFSEKSKKSWEKGKKKTHNLLREVIEK